MQVKYELRDILYVRSRRKERAQEALLKAKQALADAENFLRLQEKNRMDFVKKKPKFIQEIYEQIMRKVQFKRSYLDLIHLKLEKLDEYEMKLAIKVEKAQNEREGAYQKVIECTKVLMKKRQEVSKLEEHKRIWEEDMCFQDELMQDKELEDFKVKEKDESR